MTVGSRLTFGDPEDVTLPSEDGQSVRLPFTAVPSEAVGTALEAEATTRHELIVRLSDSRASSWGLDPRRARAVIVHAAIQYVFETVRQRDFHASEELRIDTETFPGALPERFDLPISVSGSILEVERARDALESR